MLLKAKSSIVETYPGKANETVQHALFKIDGRLEVEETEKVMKLLLASKEGKEAVDVLVTYRNSQETVRQTPLMLAIATSSGEEVKDDTRHLAVMVRVIKMLLVAGASPVKTCTQLPPLQLACESDTKKEVISMLLEHGANPNQYAGSTGETCLYAALKNGRKETVEVLLKHEVDVNSMGPNGKRPFDAICEEGQTFHMPSFVPDHSEFRLKRTNMPAGASRFLKCDLLSPEEQYYKYPYNGDKEEKYGAIYRAWNMGKDFMGPEDSVHSDHEAEPILNDFVSQGDIDKLEAMLGKCTLSEVNARDKKGQTALHKAAINNDFDFVELLLSKGADVNIKDHASNTPLNHAAKNSNSLEIIELLLAKGADVNQRGYKGKTALFQATEYNKIENVEYLCLKDAKVDIEETDEMVTPVHVAAQDNNTSILEMLFEASCPDMNVLTTFSATPLHFAARTNAKEAAAYLISKGASTVMKCFDLENTPLHVAAACDSVGVAGLLIENGAEINAQNKCQETPLFLAAATGSISALTYLIDKNSQIDAKNMHGQTPLYIAVSYEEFEAARILIQHGANIEARDKHRNETILHLATSTGNIEFIKFLLSKGANKEARDYHGLTPLLRSAAIESPGLTLTLLKHGCDSRATLAGSPEYNVIDLMGHNANVVGFKEMVSLCPKTKKPKLHPALKPLPRETKESALSTWKSLYVSKSKK